MVEAAHRSPPSNTTSAATPKAVENQASSSRGVGLAETELPMVSHKADKTPLDKALDSEKLQKLKSQVNLAQKEVEASRKKTKDNKGKGSAEPKPKQTRGKKTAEASDPKSADVSEYPKVNTSKMAAAVAAQKFMGTLVTPATPNPNRAPGRPAASATRGRGRGNGRGRGVMKKAGDNCYSMLVCKKTIADSNVSNTFGPDLCHDTCLVIASVLPPAFGI